MKNMVKMMVLSKMFGGGDKKGQNPFGEMNPMMLMMLSGGGEKGILADMFDGAFDFENGDEPEEEN